jgi:AhpD family alkylhydroperoxidase
MFIDRERYENLYECNVSWATNLKKDSHVRTIHFKSALDNEHGSPKGVRSLKNLRNYKHRTPPEFEALNVMLATSSPVAKATMNQSPQCREEESSSMDEFDRYRAGMNEKLTGGGHLGIKRFFALDTQAYEDGALDKRTKELMGLVASAVLRCDDCITYHVKQCVDIGLTRPEFLDAFNVALVVGGSITIPHLRRAIDRVDQLLEGKKIQSTPDAHQH